MFLIIWVWFWLFWIGACVWIDVSLLLLLYGLFSVLMFVCLFGFVYFVCLILRFVVLFMFVVSFLCLLVFVINGQFSVVFFIMFDLVWIVFDLDKLFWLFDLFTYNSVVEVLLWRILLWFVCDFVLISLSLRFDLWLVMICCLLFLRCDCLVALIVCFDCLLRLLLWILLIVLLFAVLYLLLLVLMVVYW